MNQEYNNTCFSRNFSIATILIKSSAIMEEGDTFYD